MTDIGHCEDCHWFDVPDRDDLIGPRDYGLCSCPKFEFMSYPSKKVYAALTDSGVLAENHEGWGMYVGPKFGCIHWSAK